MFVLFVCVIGIYCTPEMKSYPSDIAFHAPEWILYFVSGLKICFISCVSEILSSELCTQASATHKSIDWFRRIIHNLISSNLFENH
jgi:hypothetical protein